MKNVLMTIILIGGFTMTGEAQQCKPADCAPCPPGCCIINCKPSDCKTGVATNTSQSSDALFTSLLVPANCSEKPLTKKEMKSCIKTCKPMPSCTVQAGQQAATVPSATQSAEILYHPVP